MNTDYERIFINPAAQYIHKYTIFAFIIIINQLSCLHNK